MGPRATLRRFHGHGLGRRLAALSWAAFCAAVAAFGSVADGVLDAGAVFAAAAVGGAAASGLQADAQRPAAQNNQQRRGLANGTRQGWGNGKHGGGAAGGGVGRSGCFSVYRTKMSKVTERLHDFT